MLTKTIKYVDYNGTEREEKFLFNLSKAELMEMQYGTQEGLAEVITKIIEEQDIVSIMSMFKDIILKAYGEKSPDGKRFIKIDENGHKLCNKFAQSEAYSELYMELISDSEKAAAFIRAIIPNDIELDSSNIPEDILKLQEKMGVLPNGQTENSSDSNTSNE